MNARRKKERRGCLETADLIAGSNGGHDARAQAADDSTSEDEQDRAAA
jgi:hypothetical protein